MAQSRDEASPSRIELVVLASLSQSKPPSDAELGDAIQQLAQPDASVEAARRQAVELLIGLVRRGWATSDDEAARRNKRGGPSPRKLTDSGKRALRTAFNLPRVPTWIQVRDKHLPALALGIAPGSELAGKTSTESAMTAAVLGARFGIRNAFTPMAVCDALIAKALGMPAGKMTLERIRAHVLARDIDVQASDAPRPESKAYAAKLGTWIACAAIGASGTQRKVARALARQWVSGVPSPLGVGSTNDVGASTTSGPVVLAQPSARTGAVDSRLAQPAQNLLEVVRDTIPRIGAEGRFGEKVYVSAIWRRIDRDRAIGDLSLDHFKRWLLGANRDGWLVLARADLIAAMDLKQVTESEINDRGATFHFVLDQRNGASASQRESHAG